MRDRDINVWKKERWNGIIRYSFWIIVFILLFIRCFISFNGQDEAFYITSANRLMQGDRLFIDEWYMTQFYSVLLVPFLFIYKSIFMSYTGVMLFFRLLYLAFSFSICGYFSHVLIKKHNKSIIETYICMALILFYKRDNIEGMSYYNVCLLLIVLTIAFMMDKKWVLSGISIFGGILCNPYLFMLLSVLSVVFLIKHEGMKIGKVWFGLIGTGVIFIGGVMLRQDLSETINSISDIMMMVKMHSVSSPVERLKSWIYIIVMDYRYLTIPSICFIFYRTCLLLYKKGNHIANMVKKYCFIYCLGLLLFYSVRYGMVCGNAQVLLSILGLVALFSIEPWDRKMEVSAFLLIAGGIVSLCWHFASDTWDAFRIGFVISSLGAVFALCMFLENMNEWSEKSRIDWRTVTKAAICIVALCSFVSRFFYLYREENIWEQNTRITEGPAKGLYTTYEKERNYAEVLQASTEINELIELREDHTVYIDSSDIWEYLIYDAHCGGYTTWTTSINNPALKLYWEKHGYPDCVILANGSVSPITESMPDSPLYSKMLVENRIVYYKEQ